MCLESNSAQQNENHTRLFVLTGYIASQSGSRMKSKLWSRNVIQKLVFISLLIEHASVSKNKENEDMHAAWASPCRALTYAAGDRSTSASTSRWKVWHWLGDQCWFAGPGLPVLSALVLHTRFWVACPESPVLGHLSWFTYPG